MRKPKNNGIRMTLAPMHKVLNTKNETYETILTFIYRTLALNEEQKELAKKINKEPFPTKDIIINKDDGTVTMGSFLQLFLYLTHPTSTSDYQKDFLRIYISFATARLLIAYLITRYFAMEDMNDKNLIYLRAKVLEIIENWVSNSPNHFDENMKEALEVFMNFLSNNIDEKLFYEKLKEIVEILRGKENKICNECSEDDSKPPIVELPKIPENQWTLLNIPPIELARQVTIVHYSIFKEIQSDELLVEILQGRKNAFDNIDKLIKHFTNFSNYVSLTILLGETPKARGKIYKNWIDVAHEFLVLNNFHGVFSVMMGLIHRSVSRMTKTIKHALRTNSVRKANYENLLHICDISDDFQNYRKFISGIKDQCIPFIGVYQKDLIYVQETYPSKIDNLINFKKCHECCKLISIIQNYQKKGYNFTVAHRIQQLLSYLPEPTDSKDLMNLSISKEKKK